MYTRNFAFRSFCNMSDNGRFRELIDEVGLTVLMYMQGTLYTVFNREMDFMVAIPLGYAPPNVYLLIHSYIESQQEVVSCRLSHGDISNDLDGPLTQFHGHCIIEVEYRKNGGS